MIAQPVPASNHRKKSEHDRPLPSLYDQRLRVLELTIQLLIVRTSIGEHWPDGLRDVGKLLAMLQLPKSKARSAAHHLRNAKLHCVKQEYGAANFELRSLRGQLQRL